MVSALFRHFRLFRYLNRLPFPVRFLIQKEQNPGAGYFAI
jgi:hypothetical protein